MYNWPRPPPPSLILLIPRLRQSLFRMNPHPLWSLFRMSPHPRLCKNLYQSRRTAPSKSDLPPLRNLQSVFGFGRI
jgi:hypothetical protein